MHLLPRMRVLQLICDGFCNLIGCPLCEPSLYTRQLCGLHCLAFIRQTAAGAGSVLWFLCLLACQSSRTSWDLSHAYVVQRPTIPAIV